MDVMHIYTMSITIYFCSEHATFQWDSRKITTAYSSRFLSLCFIQYALHGFLQLCNYTVCL